VTDRPVLLVHGFASSFDRNWREPGWVDLLVEGGRTVIELDLPGHGSSPKWHDPEAYDAMPDAVAAAIPDGTVVDAIGFSLGAWLLLEVAAAHPERFDRIVVGGVGANLFRNDDTEAAAHAVETGTAGEGDPAVAQAFAVFGRASGNDPAALAACLRRPRRPLDPERLAAIDRPVLVVLGDRDFAGPADPLIDALPDARLVTLPGVDHFATPKNFGFLDAALRFVGVAV
jgi:pimeloyl-ACP methyl ester carboxylesterase